MSYTSMLNNAMSLVDSDSFTGLSGSQTDPEYVRGVVEMMLDSGLNLSPEADRDTLKESLVIVLTAGVVHL